MSSTIAAIAARLLRRGPRRPSGAAAAPDGGAGAGPADDEAVSTVQQVGTMEALLAGAYRGVAAVGGLLDDGDLGLGTLEALDGEFVIADGLAHRLGADGTAQPLGGSERAAFGLSVRFRPTVRRELDWSEGCEVERIVDRAARGSGLIQALRVDGTFRRVRVVSVARQEPPYRPYAEVLERAVETTWQDVAGTLVGFRTPASLEGLSGAGFRFHFISEDRGFGGRVADFTVGSGTLTVHPGAGVRLAVPPQRRPGAPRAA